MYTHENLAQKLREMRLRDKRRKRIAILVILVIAIAVTVFAIASSVDDDSKKNEPKANAAAKSDANNGNDKTIKSDGEKTLNSAGEYAEQKNEVSQEQKMLEELKPKLINIIKTKYPSVDLSFAIRNPDTGAYVEHNNKRMNSASIIKLFIMQTVFDQMENNGYTLTPENEKELREMINDSKNTAANLFIDEFGGVDDKNRVTDKNDININIKNHGYKDTELQRKMHDRLPPGTKPTGYENYSSAADVCEFLTDLYKGEAFKEKSHNDRALGYMKEQVRRTKLPSKIMQEYNDIIIANKTGELSQVDNDAAIIMCDDFNLIFVVFINEIPLLPDGNADYNLKREIQASMGDMALELVEFYKTNHDKF